jgi:succinate-semialdehyde dehydrogenase/glutarate-semialdehyde dehydrogenase
MADVALREKTSGDLAGPAAGSRGAAAAWSRAGIERRLRVLQQAGEALSARRDQLLAALQADGLSQYLADNWIPWILHQGSARLLEQYARSLVRWVKTGVGGELLVRRPDGVVLVVPPANSPTIQASSLFSILLPGNGVIVRAPENAPGVRFLVDEVLRPSIERGGFSSQLLTMVVGKSRDVLAQLMPSSDIDTVVFFGNHQAARAVAAEALKHEKKLVLELEGSDHLLVWRDAALEKAVRSACRAWDASAQPCVVPKHFLVHSALYDAFVERLIQALPRFTRTVEADPRAGALIPLARPDQFDAVLAEVRRVGEIRCGGYRMRADGSRDDHGPYAAPTIVTLTAEACSRQSLRCFAEEIFFPLIPVVRCDGTDSQVAAQMCDIVQRSPFGLRVSVWCSDVEWLAHFAGELGGSGLLLFNDDHAQAPRYASPWGGPRRSGGPHGEHHLFWEKTSRLQAIGCNQLKKEEVLAVLKALGCLPAIGVP